MLILGGTVVPRQDAIAAIGAQFDVLAAPGGAFSGRQRVELAASARSAQSSGDLQDLARRLYTSPAAVHEKHVRRVADIEGDAPVVELVGIVARLSCVDRINGVLGVQLDSLPEPLPGPPTGAVATGMKRRRGFLPKPPGEIPVALDLVPTEGEALRAMFGPMYMTDGEMSDPYFERSPGLNTPQLETIAARVSYLNECFY